MDRLRGLPWAIHDGPRHVHEPGSKVPYRANRSVRMLARLVVPWDPGNSVGFDDKPRHDVPPSGHGVTTSRSSPRPGLARGSDRAARPHNLGSSSGGALRPDAALLTLQRGAGNRAVTRLMAAQGREQRPVPGPQRPVPTAAPTPPAPTTPAQPGAQQVVELYPIFDRVARRRAMVNSERYEQERAALGRLMRYLAKTIPASAAHGVDAAATHDGSHSRRPY
jgi:hypothetical protein